MRRLSLPLLLLLAACSSTDNPPTPKQLQYDPATGALVYPAPCPDWSKDASTNYNNTLHTNFGCATQTNMGLQLADPQDWAHGHGDSSADTETTVKTMQDYRAGKIPQPLSPLQSDSTSGSSQ